MEHNSVQGPLLGPLVSINFYRLPFLSSALIKAYFNVERNSGSGKLNIGT